MGTAYIGGGQDSSYFEANPAASSLLDYTELAVYHNNWIADTKIEGAVYTISTGASVSEWREMAIPVLHRYRSVRGPASEPDITRRSMAGFNVSYDFLPGILFQRTIGGRHGQDSVPFRAGRRLGRHGGGGNSAAGAMVDRGLL